ncbi:hypothetical protein HK096_009993 [Nowakowskiella sp. JEL0078]|nr:hypothetical protein HK096_009993 [Nowakowskiella sp. JEL0078]
MITGKIPEILISEKIVDSFVEEKISEAKIFVESKLDKKYFESKSILDSKENLPILDEKEKQPVLDRNFLEMFSPLKNTKIRKENEKTETKKLDFSSAFSELQKEDIPKEITSLLHGPVNPISPPSEIKSLNFKVNTKQDHLRPISPNQNSVAQISKNTNNGSSSNSQKTSVISETRPPPTAKSIIKQAAIPKSKILPDPKQNASLQRQLERRSSLRQAPQHTAITSQGRAEIRAPRKSISVDNLNTNLHEHPNSRGWPRNNVESLVRGVESVRREVQNDRKSVGSIDSRREIQSERKTSIENTRRETLEPHKIVDAVSSDVRQISVGRLEEQNISEVVQSILDPFEPPSRSAQQPYEAIKVESNTQETAVIGIKELQSSNEEVPYGVLTGLVQDCLEDFRVQIRMDVLNIHVELVKRFQIQQVRL